MISDPESIAEPQPSFRSQVGLTAAANVGITVLGFITGILLARLLGPGGRGELAAMQLWPTSIATIAALGLPEAIVYLSASRPREAERFLGSALALSCLIASPVMAVGYLLMPYLLSAQPDEVVRTARILLIFIPVFTLVGLPVHLLRGKSQFRAWNLARLLPAGVWIIIIGVAAAWGWGPRPIALVHLAGMAALVVPFTLILRPHLSAPVRVRVADWKPLLHYGLPNALTGVPQLLNLRLDQMLIAASLPPADLGIYVVAVAWSSAMQPLLSAVGTALQPRVASADSATDRRVALVSGSQAGVTAALVTGLGLALITPLLPLALGESFRPAVPIALVLVVASGLLGLNGVLEEGLRGLGRPTTILRAELIGAAATVAALLALLPPFEIKGAALASLLGYAAVTMSLSVSLRHEGISISTLFKPRWGDLVEVLRWIRRGGKN